jgi:hypothetical protein
VNTPPPIGDLSYDHRSLSTEKMDETRDPATQCVVVLTCDPVGSAATAARVQVLHWKSGHKIGCKRKGRVDFALFNPHR